jgi:hypothetical protein
MVSRRAVAVAIAFAVCLTGCAARTARDRHFVAVAEALTSPTISEGIRVAPRAFSAPTLVDACQSATSVERLKVSPPTLELVRGNRYSLGSLTVVAVTAADIAVPDQPIVIEVEDREPPVLQLRSDDVDLNEGRVLAIGAGDFRVRVRTMCGGPYAETVIRGRVTP